MAYQHHGMGSMHACIPNERAFAADQRFNYLFGLVRGLADCYRTRCFTPLPKNLWVAHLLFANRSLAHRSRAEFPGDELFLACHAPATVRTLLCPRCSAVFCAPC